MFNLKRFTIIYVIVVLSVQAFAADESESDKKIEAFRLKLLECQTKKIKEKEVASTQEFTSDSAKAMCKKAYMSLNGCVVRNDRKIVSYQAPPGYRIEGQVGFHTSGATSRGTKGSISQQQSSANITISCSGNLCDRAKDEWISGYLVGQIQKIVTDQEIKEIQKQCLGELSK